MVSPEIEEDDGRDRTAAPIIQPAGAFEAPLG